eukprot:gene29921-37342_t
MLPSLGNHVGLPASEEKYPASQPIQCGAFSPAPSVPLRADAAPNADVNAATEMVLDTPHCSAPLRECKRSAVKIETTAESAASKRARTTIPGVTAAFSGTTAASRAIPISRIAAPKLSLQRLTQAHAMAPDIHHISATEAGARARLL